MNYVTRSFELTGDLKRKCPTLKLHFVLIALYVPREHITSTARPDVHLADFMNTTQHGWGSGLIKSIINPVSTHLVDSNQTVQPTEAFRPIYQVWKKQTKYIRYRIVTIAEAVRFSLFDLTLCDQKQLIQALKLLDTYSTLHSKPQLT